MAKLQVPSLPLPHQGMMLDKAQHMLPDDFCFYSQDVLFDQPGKIRSRGPLNVPVPTPGTLPGDNDIVYGITSLNLSDGDTRIMIAYYDSATGRLFAAIYDGATAAKLADLSSFTEGWGTGEGIGDNYLIFDAKPAFGQGKLISLVKSPMYSSTTNRPTVYYWRGAAKATYGTGTVTLTQGSATVTGAGTTWLANVEKGMFLIRTGGGGSSTYVGTVQSVGTNTSLTLENPVVTTTAAGQAYKLVSVRTLYPVEFPWITDGVATASTTSTTVTGGNTKWVQEKVATNNLMFRQRDMAFIGTVSTVNNDISITLGANAANTLDGEEYVIVPGVGFVRMDQSDGGVPTFHAFWKNYQFLANWNSGRVSSAGYKPTGSGSSDKQTSATLFIRGPAFIDEADPSKSGTYIPFTPQRADALSTAITGLGVSESALLVFMEHETHIVQGNNPDDFQQRLLLNDGCICSSSIVSYKGGVIWAGYDSIYYYDGVQVNDLLKGRVRTYYQLGIKRSTSTPPFAFGAVLNNHYVLNPATSTYPIDDTRTVRMWQKTTQLAAPNGQLQWCINMDTGAVGTFSNFALIGAADTGFGDQWLLFNNNGTRFDGALIASANTVFSDSEPITSRADTWTTSDLGAQAGPTFYLETKLYDFGNPELKKLFRQAQLWYQTANVDGLNTSVSLDVFAAMSRTALASFSSVELQNTPAGNLLNNPSFEKPLLLTGWSTAGSYWLNAGATLSSVVDDPNNAKSGSGYGVLVLPGTLTQQGADTTFPCVSGHTYTYSLWAKRIAGNPAMALGIGSITVGFNSVSIFPVGTDWTRYQVTFTATATGAGRAAFYATGAVTGTMWIDAAKVEEGTSPTSFFEGDNTIAAINTRKKFLIRSTHIGLRLWQSILHNDKGTKLYAWAVGLKPMRPGRV